MVIEVCMQNFESLTFPLPEVSHKFFIFMREGVIEIDKWPPENRPNFKGNEIFD